MLLAGLQVPFLLCPGTSELYPEKRLYLNPTDAIEHHLHLFCQPVNTVMNPSFSYLSVTKSVPPRKGEYEPYLTFHEGWLLSAYI